MSRYQHKINVINTTNGRNKHFNVAYGYDNPLQEYFIQVSYVDEDGEDSFIIDKGSRSTQTDRDEMMMLFILFGVSEEHKGFLVLDLPF